MRRGFAAGLAAILVIVGAVLALIPSGGGAPEKEEHHACVLELNTDLTYSVDEQKQRLAGQPAVVSIKGGSTKLTLVVPKEATGKHGIGLTDGDRDRLGALVGPGRSTSLTFRLGPGSYTVFDSFEDNRAKGYSARFIVPGEKPAEKPDGPCGPNF